MPSVGKHCIFCGSPPKSKTKEHVVPRWLIELTGKPSRVAQFGVGKGKDGGDRAFAFDKFTFPACDDCNARFANLEGAAKPVVLKALTSESLTGQEVSLFLDWLDKIRVGLWLGFRQLDGDIARVSPNFHIETRSGQYDRLLIIERSDLSESKLLLGGADTLSFAFSPTAFVLTINNVAVTNISQMYLFSRRLGFPFPRSMHFLPDREQVMVDLAPGLERIIRPLLRRPIRERGPLNRPGVPGDPEP